MMRSPRWIFVLWIAGLLFVHRYVFEGNVEAGRDLYRLFIPEAAYLRDRLLKGELPLWNPWVRLGQPFAATLTSEAFYPPHVALVLLLGPTWGIQASIVFHAALGSAGAYLASRRLGAGRHGAVIAGAFGFTPLFTRLAGSLHMTSAMAWSGVIVVAALNLRRSPSVRSAAWLAIPLALSFLCGAPEVVLWQGALAVGLSLTGRAPKRALGFCALAAGWSLALCALVILPAAELWRMSVQPGAILEDRYFWSASPAQLLSMFWPWADEKRSAEDQWLATSLFIGAIPALLALAAVRRSRAVAVLVAVAGVCAVLCLGQHFLPAKLLLALPPLSGFRHPVKYALGLSFCVALLSGQGLRRLSVWARREQPRVRRVAGVLVGGLALIAVLQAIAALAPWRAGMKSGALWFGFCATLVALAFAAFSGTPRGSRRVRTALVLLVAAELALAGVLMGNVAVVDPALLSRPGKLAAALRAEAPGRISIDVEDAEPSPEQAAYPSRQFILDSRENLIGLRPLEEGLAMVEGYGFRDPWRQTQALVDKPRGPYDVFGVTHFVRRGSTAPYPDLERVGAEGWSTAWRSKTAFPRAWVVQQGAVATDAQALTALRDEPQSLRTRALLAEGPPVDQPPCASTVRVEEETVEQLRFHVDACDRGYLVIADSHYPGWVATVGEVPQPIQRANYLLRAVAIPKGSAIVRLEYRPISFRIGGLISVLGWAIAVGALFGLSNRLKLLKSRKIAPSSR